MKNGSQRYDINRTRPRHGHKYTKYKICISMMMVMWTHGKVKKHWDWVEKSVAYKKIVSNGKTIKTSGFYDSAICTFARSVEDSMCLR